MMVSMAGINYCPNTVRTSKIRMHIGKTLANLVLVTDTLS